MAPLAVDPLAYLNSHQSKGHCLVPPTSRSAAGAASAELIGGGGTVGIWSAGTGISFAVFRRIRPQSAYEHDLVLCMSKNTSTT